MLAKVSGCAVVGLTGAPVSVEVDIAPAFHRVLKVARTIADLAQSDRIEAAQVAEAVQYRRRGGDQ